LSSPGGRQGSGKRGGGNASGRAVARRQGLLVFGVTFLILFVVVAIAEGLGQPSVPSGDVAVVEEAPGDSGKITRADLDHSLELAAKQAGQDKVPKPGDPQYDELVEAALGTLLEAAWLEGQADEMGISATDKEVAQELAKVKKENFPKESEFKKFIKESGFTEEDIDERVKLQILSTQIQEQLTADAPQPSEAEVENYYEAAKAAQFTQPASIDVRIVRNKDRAKAEQALEQLEKANTAKDWDRVAKRFSEDPATKDSGGLQQNVAEGTLEEPLGAAVSDAVEGQLEGPVKTEGGFTIFEVQKSNPETVQDLKEVEAQIKGQLAQQLQQESFGAFVTNFNGLWLSRTFCADDYLIERCANFEGDSRPATAPPGCYEENPEGGLPEACPAPVFQAVPALPGTVTPLEPRGKPLAQRPVPAGGEVPEEPAGLPEGFTPPPAE